MSKSPDAFRTISEVADWLGVQAHVLRFWESKFDQVKPVKRAGGRRYYRPSDMLLLGGIKKLLHDDGLTIKGVQKMMREQGVAYVSDLSQPLDETADEIVQERPAQGATIVRFADRAEPPAPVQPAKPEIEEAQFSLELGAETAASDPEPEVLEPDEPESPAEALPEEPVAEDPAIESPALPSFLHRPMAPPEPEPVPEPAATVEAELSEPETIEDPVAEVAEPEPVVDATITDPPDAGDLPYHPGALERLTRIDRLSPELAEEIAPLARQLRQWHDRAVKLGTG